MKIEKFKKLANGRYQLSLDDGNTLQLYEEVILKYELLLKKKIDNIDIPEIEEYNIEWDVYYTALKSLKSRFRSSYELRRLLLDKSYPIELVDKAIQKLEDQKYLDDRSFTKGYINNQIITSSRGPNRIIKDLVTKGIDKNIIYDEIGVFDEEIQKEKINKIIKISIKSNRTRGGMVLKNKIVNDLINNGYSYDIIQKVINNYEFGNDSLLAKKEYDKLYKKLSRKYSGSELAYKIKEKLYQKGLSYED